MFARVLAMTSHRPRRGQGPAAIARPRVSVMDADEGCCDTSASLPCVSRWLVPVLTRHPAVHTAIDKLYNIPTLLPTIATRHKVRAFSVSVEISCSTITRNCLTCTRTALLWLMFDDEDASVSTGVLFKHGTHLSFCIHN